MGAFVVLIKEFEDEEKVTYNFGPDESIMGKIELNKKTKIFAEIEPVDSNDSSKFYFNRAAQRLAKCLIREGGSFPEKNTFES